jgi:hypothetical protein
MMPKSAPARDGTTRQATKWGTNDVKLLEKGSRRSCAMKNHIRSTRLNVLLDCFDFGRLSGALCCAVVGRHEVCRQVCPSQWSVRPCKRKLAWTTPVWSKLDCGKRIIADRTSASLQRLRAASPNKQTPASCSGFSPIRVQQQQQQQQCAM